MDKIIIVQESLQHLTDAANLVNNSIVEHHNAVRDTLEVSIEIVTGLEQVVATFAGIYMAVAIYKMERMAKLKQKPLKQDGRFKHTMRNMTKVSLYVIILSLSVIIFDSILLFFMPTSGLLWPYFVLILIFNIHPLLVVTYSIYLNIHPSTQNA